MKRTRALGRPPTSTMTSMIDVVFLLLIFFLCTLKFRVLEGRLDSELPKDAGPSATPMTEMLETFDVYVLEDPRFPKSTAVRLGLGPLHPVGALPGLIVTVAERFPDPDVRIVPGDDVTYGQVVSVVDACFAGGLERIRFAGP